MYGAKPTGRIFFLVWMSTVDIQGFEAFWVLWTVRGVVERSYSSGPRCGQEAVGPANSLDLVAPVRCPDKLSDARAVTMP